MASSKIGSIYAVPLRSSGFAFFQHIGFDETQMASEVIRVFKLHHESILGLDLEGLARGEIDFHAHTTIYFGIKMKLWQKIGSVTAESGLEKIRFRTSLDYGVPSIKRSSAWQIWVCGQPQIYVGDLPLENIRDEIGVIFSPDSIVDRIETGNYNMVHPHPKSVLDTTILPP